MMEKMQRNLTTSYRSQRGKAQPQVHSEVARSRSSLSYADHFSQRDLQRSQLLTCRQKEAEAGEGEDVRHGIKALGQVDGIE